MKTVSVILEFVAFVFVIVTIFLLTFLHTKQEKRIENLELEIIKLEDKVNHEAVPISR